MTQLTIRGIDEKLHKSLKEAAARQDVSMNRYLVRVLNEAVGIYQVKSSQQTQEYDDLDHLAGSWREDEADEFDRLLAEQRSIDESLWQ
jgi:hypothetical protein